MSCMSTLAYRAVENAVAQIHVSDPLQTDTANLFSGQSVETVIREAPQICGTNGYQQGHPRVPASSPARLAIRWRD
jgi:alkylation response protein AidB-like acyl-CoA dehydrogenase